VTRKRSLRVVEEHVKSADAIQIASSVEMLTIAQRNLNRFLQFS